MYSAEVDEFPSAENLESAIDSLIESLKRDVDDMEMIPDFEDGVLGVRRDANALAVVAMTLAVSDSDASAASVASGLIETSQALANAKTGEEVKIAYKALVDARSKTGKISKAEWKKVASLRPLMKYAIPSLSAEIKRLSRNEKTFLRASNARKVIDDSTVMVAIAMGCRENVDETLSPNDEKVWKEYCERLAATTLEFNKQANLAAAKNGNFDDLKTAFKQVEETCNSTCHEKFGGKSAE